MSSLDIRSRGDLNQVRAGDVHSKRLRLQGPVPAHRATGRSVHHAFRNVNSRFRNWVRSVVSISPLKSKSAYHKYAALPVPVLNVELKIRLSDPSTRRLPSKSPYSRQNSSFPFPPKFPSRSPSSCLPWASVTLVASVFRK